MEKLKLPDVVFDVPAAGWRMLQNGAYLPNILLTKTSAMAHLVKCGTPQKLAKLHLDAFDEQTLVYGADMAPGLPPLFHDPLTGVLMMNHYAAPTLVPREAPFPRIEAIAKHLANNDPEAERYLHHLVARKYQDLNVLPKVAVIFGTTQGHGKGLFQRVLAEIFGPRNCALVGQSEIESRFLGGRIAHKLFVFADEVVSSENAKDISEKLKILVDGGEIEVERKYENTTPMRNRALWMFASNSPVSPLQLQGSDRRYTFLTNFEPVTPEYTATLVSCFKEDRTTFTDDFMNEIAGYAHYLGSLEVDVPFVSKPFVNEAREALIDASRPSYEVFLRDVCDRGFDAVFEEMSLRDFNLTREVREDWDFGTKGVATSVLYRTYRTFCVETGQQPLRLNKFGGALKNWVPKFEHKRDNYTKGGRRVWCYVVPRKKKPEVETAPKAPEES